MSVFPGVTVIIVGRNCAKHLFECIHPITIQKYPKECIEILFVDGESTDNTREVAEQLGAKVVHGGYPNNAEARRYVGVKYAQHEILAFIDTDNIILYPNWIRDMVQPFLEYPQIYSSFTKWYGFSSNTSAIEQYYALSGGNDPISFYLGKNDRVPYLENKLPLGAHLIIDAGKYQIVSLSSKLLPAIGCNGFLVKKSVLERLNYQDYNAFMHIDVHVDIINELQENKYAIVKTSILHCTGSQVFKSIQKRIRYMNLHHVALKDVRRYQIFNIKSCRDVILLTWCVICALTLMEPLWRSYLGWKRTKNKNWFLHPWVTLIFTISYGANVLCNGFKKILNLISYSRKKILEAM